MSFTRVIFESQQVPNLTLLLGKDLLQLQSLQCLLPALYAKKHRLASVDILNYYHNTRNASLDSLLAKIGDDIPIESKGLPSGKGKHIIDYS